MFSEDDLLPISALQHLLFCPRQCALIHVERLWAENSLTLEGRHLHEKADKGKAETRGRGRRKPESADIPAGALRVTRALLLRSFEHGLFGKADVVEFRPVAKAQPATAEHAAARPAAGRPFPVEYKRGKPKKDRSDEVQLCAQALCLEEMLGVSVPAGALFYARTRRRVEVPFDTELRGFTLKTIARLHEMIGSQSTPTAEREKKCERCSLKNLCLPNARLGSDAASRYLRRTLTAAAADAGPSGE